MKNRVIAVILTAIMAMSCLAGCGNNAEEDTTEKKATVQDEETDAASTDDTDTVGADDDEASIGDKVSLTVLCGYAGEDPHGQYIYQYAEAYMREHPNVEIEIQSISTNDIYTKLSSMATTPSDLPEVFFTSADAVATLHDLGLTQDLAGLLSDENIEKFAEGVIDSCKFGDEITYFPIAVQPQAVIYRQDRFEEAGLSIPTNWDDFVKCAQALTKDEDDDGTAEEWGFGMIGANNSSGQSRFLSYLWANGVDAILEENGEWGTDLTVDNEKLSQAFTRWTDMNVEGIVPIGITEVDYPTAANYFAMGYTSMFMTGSNALGVAYANNPDLEGKLGSFKLPGEYAGTMLGTEGYAVSSHADEATQEVAVDFLNFFVEHDQEMSFWQSSGKIPATTDGQTAEYIMGDDYAGYLQQIADGCRPVASFAGISGLKSVLGDAYASVFSEEKTSEQALEILESATKELLEDYN